MSFRTLRSTALKSCFAELSDFLLNQDVLSHGLGSDLLLSEIEKHNSLLQCLNTAESPVKSEKNLSSRKSVRQCPKSVKHLKSENRVKHTKENDKEKMGKTEEEESLVPVEKESEEDPGEESVAQNKALKSQKIDSEDELLSNETDENIHELNSCYEDSDDSLFEKNGLEEEEESENDINETEDQLQAKKQLQKQIEDSVYLKETNADFYQGTDIHTMIFNSNKTYKSLAIEGDKRLELNPIARLKSSKMFTLYGIDANKDFEARKFVFIPPQDLVEDKDRQEIDENDENKPSKVSLGVHCPGNLPDTIDVASISGFEPITSNLHQHKLHSIDDYTVNDELLQFEPPLINAYHNFKDTRDQSGIEVFKTAGKGLGLRALRTYTPGEMVAEYTGEILTYKEFLNSNDTDHALHFVDGFVLSGGAKGSLARFINHSVKPNCCLRIFICLENYKVVPKIGIFVIPSVEITVTDELTMNYNDNRIYNIKPKRCFCGEPECSGFIRFHYTKLKLISMTAFAQIYEKENISNVEYVKSLMRETNITNFSLGKLKKLSLYGSIEPETSESLFYVVGASENTNKQVVKSEAMKEIPQKAAENKRKIPKKSRAKHSEKNGSVKSEKASKKMVKRVTKHKEQVERKRDSQTKWHKQRQNKHSSSDKDSPQKRRRLASLGVQLKNQHKPLSNGSSEFGALPEKYKHELEIDMVKI